MSFFEPFHCPITQHNSLVGIEAPITPPVIATSPFIPGSKVTKKEFPLFMALDETGKLMLVFPLKIKKD
jgi:hypothetical protein